MNKEIFDTLNSLLQKTKKITKNIYIKEDLKYKMICTVYYNFYILYKIEKKSQVMLIKVIIPLKLLYK